MNILPLTKINKKKIKMDGWRCALQFEDSMQQSFLYVDIKKKEKPIQMVKLKILFEFHFYRQPGPSIFSSEDVACSFVLSPSTRKE